MKEITDIVAAFDRAQSEGKQSALATVVHVEGSSYRRPGARMLVTEDGQLTGAISGGCLEGDALRKALYTMRQRQNKLVIYDTTHEDDIPFGVQLGCNGIVHILFEPIDDTKEVHPIHLLRELIGERREAVLLTLFSLDRFAEQPGTALLYAGGKLRSGLGVDWQEVVMADIKGASRDRKSGFKEYAHSDKLFKGFIEFIPPPPAVVIAGAGNDVLPLVDITVMLGWHTTVVDGRSHYATARRFGKADKVLVARPEKVLDQLTTDALTIFLLMTHNYNYDLALLKELLRKDFQYIGLLGPRKKLDRMLDELREGGTILHPDRLASIHSPVGLDIGAETAEEIAVSIVAEIKAVLSGVAGGSLREKGDPIHSRPALLSSHE